MPHASVTSTYQQNDPSCYCVLGCLKTLSQWKKSGDGSSAPPSSILGKDRNRKSKDFFVRVQFSISLAMGRDAPQPHSIITLFHWQKHRKLFQQSYFSQWNIELISRRLWTSPLTWKGNRGRWGWREKCDRGQWELKNESKKKINSHEVMKKKSNSTQKRDDSVSKLTGVKKKTVVLLLLSI